MYKNKNNPDKLKVAKFRPTRYVIAVVVVIVVIVLALELLHIINIGFSGKKAVTVSGSSYTKGEKVPEPSSNSKQSQQQINTSGNNNVSIQPSNQKNTTESPSSLSLLDPTGNFVSAHQVNPNTPITSVCNTTPGATCKITFTDSSGTEKSLSTETADSNGSVFWNDWTPKSAGITPGTWTIRAVANLNGQTKSAQDAINLQVNT